MRSTAKKARSGTAVPPDKGVGSATPVDPHDQLRTRIAWYYYVEGLTQRQIAERLRINRIRVNRILASCREEGLVQIRINSKLTTCIELERKLERAFGLDEVVVVPSPALEEDVPEVLGVAAGTYISGELRDGQSVGLGWGRTLRISLRSIQRRPLRDLSVVSLLGGLTRGSAMNTYETAARFADLFDAECYYLAGPAFTSTEASRDLFLDQEVLKEVYERAKHVDLALVSAGDVTDTSTIRRLGLITQEELSSLKAAGAVGDLLGHFLDIEGRIVDHPINRRVLALAPEELKRIPKVVVTSGGESKVSIIRGVLHGGYADVLITDEATAGRLSESAS